MMMNNTIHRVRKYIADNKLFSSQDCLLVAVSGGIDSMLLLHILHQLKYKLIVAHVNFQLRESDSDADEKLVAATCKKLNIEYYIHKVDTLQIVNQSKDSIQMVARQLRYEWLHEIQKEKKCACIAVAHHGKDQSETVLQHLTKGYGIAGLRGMLPKNNHIVRPLLCLDKNQINYLAELLKIPYREDSSNASDKYERNFIRHHVIPKLEEINPKLHQAVFHGSNYLYGVENIYQSYIQKRLKKLVRRTAENSYTAPAKSFANDQHGLNLLYEWLHSFAFNSEQINDIYSHLKNNASGKEFFADKFRLIIDRKSVFVHPNNFSQSIYVLVEQIPLTIKLDTCQVQIEQTEQRAIEFDRNNMDIYVDAEDIDLPIIIRNWEEGDYMYPLGMKMKKKKLSDMFIDKKIAKHLKSKLLCFFSANKLFFVEGIGIDERFKVKENSTKLIRIHIEKIKQ